ncbi:MAG: hypothetical protein ACXV8O_01395 [Methylobacter sp.]
MGGSSSTPESFDRVASTKRSNLVRQQWDDYKARFQPTEDNLISQMGTGIHTTFNDAGLATAQNSVDTAFSNADASQARDLSRYGQGYNAGQLENYKTNSDIAKSTAGANAVNTASEWDIDRRNAAVSGGLSDAATVGRG